MCSAPRAAPTISVRQLRLTDYATDMRIDGTTLSAHEHAEGVEYSIGAGPRTAVAASHTANVYGGKKPMLQRDPHMRGKGRRGSGKAPKGSQS